MTVTVNEDKINELVAPNEALTLTKTGTECPRCNNKFCERIKRGAIVKTILFWLPLKRYHCPKCQNRFYKRT